MKNQREKKNLGKIYNQKENISTGYFFFPNSNFYSRHWGKNKLNRIHEICLFLKSQPFHILLFLFLTKKLLSIINSDMSLMLTPNE